MMLGLQSMIDQANKVGGIPSHIELSSQEATNLIEELCFVLKEVPSSLAAFRFILNEQILNFERLRKLSPLNTDAEIVSQWKNKKLSISFMRIELIIVDVTSDNEKYHE